MAARRSVRAALIALAALLVLAAGALAFLPRLIDTPAIHAYVVQAASQAVGRPVRFDALSIALLPLPNVRLEGLEVADDPHFGTAPFLKVPEVRLGVRVRPLLSLRIELASLSLDGARVELVESGGRWNAATLGAPSTPAKSPPRSVPGIPGSAAVGSVMVSRVTLTNAAIHVRRQGEARGLRIEGINATVTGVGGPELDIRGEARAEPGGVKLSNIRATVGARSADMPVRASLGVEAADVGPLAEAVAGPSPALSGPVKGSLQASGTVSKLAATGELDFTRVTVSEDRKQCPPPTRRRLVLEDVRMPIRMSPTSFTSAPLQARMGKGTVSLAATAALAEPSRLVTLSGIRIGGLELLPVLQDFLCQSYAISGPLDLDGELALRPTDMWRSMNGSGKLKVGRGKVIGQGALNLARDILVAGSLVEQAMRGKLTTSPGKTALEFEFITATYRITNGIVRTDDLLYQGKDLRLSAAGTYGLADGSTDMAVTINQGAGQFRARVTGSGGSMKVVPTGVKINDPKGVKKFLDRLLR